MTTEILLSIGAVILGLIVLIWSADRFIDGAASLARIFGIPAFLIGALIIGFGTSAPEMVVSVLSAMQGNPNIALGNAYGSNITNIALVLGATALVSAIVVDKNVVTRELPILILITLVSGWQLLDGEISFTDAIILLVLLVLVLGRSIWDGMKNKPDLSDDMPEEMSKAASFVWLMVGFVLLVVSSRMLVWGAVNIATEIGVSDLVIGLTVIAIGTSLPELVSSIAAARKGEHGMAIGNVVGSNVFNTLAVVGLAGVIAPMKTPELVLQRDFPIMLGLTLLLLAFTAWAQRGRDGAGKVGKLSGVILLLSYFGYTAWLVSTAMA